MKEDLLDRGGTTEETTRSKGLADVLTESYVRVSGLEGKQSHTENQLRLLSESQSLALLPFRLSNDALVIFLLRIREHPHQLVLVYIDCSALDSISLRARICGVGWKVTFLGEQIGPEEMVGLGRFEC
jgi:hypothetical protein